MSYPEPRYHGEGGEVSARIRRADSEPDLVTPGATYHYLATGERTDGDFGLYRVDMGPLPGGPGSHFHRTISETFFILSGTVRLFQGERWVDAHPGDFMYVPPGGLHGFRNESGEPASLLLMFAAGAPREPYFEGIPRIAEMTEEERAEFFARHDNIWVPAADPTGPGAHRPRAD